jgi:cell division protein FtsB
VKNLVLAAAVAAALSSTPLRASAASSDDLAQIREQLQGLMQRVDNLEQENTALKTQNETLKAEGDNLKTETSGLRKDAATTSAAVAGLKGAEWTSRVALSGDFRYRFDSISDDTLNASGIRTADRYRDRIRARFNAVARANDHITVGLGFATDEGGDPRASNETLTNVFSRKGLDLDLAYFDWKFASWGDLVAGKMRQPFFKPGQSLSWDNDINPEGLALVFNHGIFFGSVYDYWLQEVSGAENTTTSDPMMYGAQFGARLPISDSLLTLAAHYYELKSAQYRSPFFIPTGGTLSPGLANGNSTCTQDVVAQGFCRGVLAPNALAFNFEVINLSAQFDTTIGKLPLTLWADGAQNQDPDDHDTYWAGGALLGRASDDRSWEAGVFYEHLEKDALFAQLIDSDFAGGVSDTEGWVFKLGYAPLRNWVVNATYFLNKRNMDVPTASGQSDINFDRLEVDVNVKF